MLLCCYAYLSWARNASYALIYLKLIQIHRLKHTDYISLLPDRLLSTLLFGTATPSHICLYFALLILYCYFFFFFIFVFKISAFSILDCEQLSAGADLCLLALFLSEHSKRATNNRHSISVY